ncbi:MAG: GNAT family N-acetyltransferase [Bdellovibrionales bacterium]|nr:GNAT family N-acetyltransferase [Bdellovibrionales bacterium]
MKFELRPFDFDSAEDCGLMAKWSNDPELRHLARVNASDADYAKFVTPEEVSGWRPRPGDGKEDRRKWSWMCLADGVPVGECSLQLGVPHRLWKEPDVAWFGILLGEASARGRGLGRAFFALLEDEARRIGATRAELGVFEFNTRARRLYEKLGYERFGSVSELTWWNGKFWTDFRYRKNL